MKWFNLRNKLFRKKIKEINNLEDKLNPTYDSSETEKQILVSGNRSVAFGVRDFAIPTGICSEPIFKELNDIIKNDKLGQLLNNPICKCVFYNTSNGYCFFAGLCDKKQEISNSAIEQYKEHMKAQINQIYGEE
jgi:hypothetical protein